MATALPCVSTKVGDAAELGAEYIVLANAEPKSLAAALRKMLNQPKEQRLALAESGRDSVVSRFSIVQVAAQYHDLYLDVLER
jgi:glycosyltransferase involved in cell wall biosynthesis